MAMEARAVQFEYESRDIDGTPLGPIWIVYRDDNARRGGRERRERFLRWEKPQLAQRIAAEMGLPYEEIR